MFRYRYEKIKDWLVFEKPSNDTVTVRDVMTDREYVLSRHLAYFAMRLDGKQDPYRIYSSKEDVKACLQELRRHNLLRKNRIIEEFRTPHLTIWTPKDQNNNQKRARVCNAMLLVLFLPILMWGYLLYLRADNSIHFQISQVVVDSIISTIVMSFFHELAHMSACLGYGGQVYEIGFRMTYFVLPSAYTFMDVENIGSRLKRTQILAAGVEMNFLLSGIAMILSTRIPLLTAHFYIFAWLNLIVALNNLLFFGQLDGMRILSEIIGTSLFPANAYTALKTKTVRKALKEKGITGWATLSMYVIALILQVSEPLVLIAMIGEWFL